MIVRRGQGDLNRIYRPCKIDEVVGQETIKNTIKNSLENRTFPQSSLFTGPSGCGKTTFARIIALGLNCEEGPTSSPCCKCDSCKAILASNSFAVIEIDAARTSDVAHVRELLKDLPSASLGGERYKVVIFDEAHNLSGKAEDSLLKFLEDVPHHVYIILCTNEPQKLKVVTRNRCKVVQFGRLLEKDIYKLLEEVSQFEGFPYTKEVLQYIAEESEGVPRAALSFLQQVASEGSWTKEAASMIVNFGVDVDSADVFEFCKYILNSSNFKGSMRFYKEKKIHNVPTETVRIHICGFFVGCLKNAKAPSDADKYSAIIDLFSEPLFHRPKPEHTLINNIYKTTKILRS